MSMKYNIEVYEDFVYFYGNLNIEETFDFLNYFEKKGFDAVVKGFENSTLCLMKNSQEKEEANKIEREEKLSDVYNKLYLEEVEKNQVLLRRISEVETMTRMIFSDENGRVQKLIQENKLLSDKLRLLNLQNDPRVSEILKENLPDGTSPKDMTCDEVKEIVESYNL